MPWTITVHMFLALLIVALLFYLIHRASFSTPIHSPVGFWWLMACMATLLVQVLLGTQVREAIDRVAGSLPRHDWIANLGSEFFIHRSFSWIVLVLHVGLILKLRKTEGTKAFPLILILLILGTLVTGIGMALFAVPPYLQPVHLLLATVTFGLQFLLLLKLNRSEQTVSA
jgi:cytochrome c oxidase assembly protein subunit 15